MKRINHYKKIEAEENDIEENKLKQLELIKSPSKKLNIINNNNVFQCH